MKIFDLTRGKYPQLYYPALSYEKDLEHVIHGCSRFINMFQPPRTDLKSILNEVPIFLVESAMANEYVAVPGCECSVRVPNDIYLSPVGKEFDIDDWMRFKEEEISDKKNCERILLNCTIYDMLGVYVLLQDNNPIPRRIFIWTDKIVDYTTNHTKNRADITGNASALFDLVLFHEIGHALMDVELYGIHPSPYFSYGNDYIYRFVEEAYANGIALSIIINDPSRRRRQGFIEEFVMNQGPGYSDGFQLSINHNVEQWMAIKVLFNYEFALLLSDMWKSPHCIPLENCVDTVGRAGWLAVKDHNYKWGFIELTTYKMLKGFKKYDSIEAFDENGLCKVKSDNHYGYINEQGAVQISVKYGKINSFENGLTTAKLNDKFGIIDKNGKIVVPFSLDYLDMDGFRNGYASMMDQSGWWGAIDTKGNVVVPCEYEFQVKLDVEGHIEIEKMGHYSHVHKKYIPAKIKND